MGSFLDLYEPLDVIGNGSFGIIRKVRRKTDGTILARKELNFEKMAERDRKQIVAEVNILKDLHHDHIVRYHDRYVDREAGILHILMEYCGGGDLSIVIKQAQKHNRPIPEDTIWNYFLQILLALHHCHHPNGHVRSGSGSGPSQEPDGKEKRPQILHRDLKPDNVFLDETNTVKLGDFGLSKALSQSSFANTYVGTPYYMSPELMQEKAYDSKSDIWSLGCLIYELCALKPPFHEAKTHSELSILIRNGRIPPLPRGYSQALSSVIKAMLNLNPAMRPSAAQLLQHERLDLAFKVAETEKMLITVKSHKAAVLSREREVLSRETVLAEKEAQFTLLLNQKDTEIASLQSTIAEIQNAQAHEAQHAIQAQVRAAVSKREDELRIAVTRREEEVAAAMARREEEIINAIRKHEAEIAEAWRVREEQIRKEVGQEVDERVNWVIQRTEELNGEEERLESIRKELEEKARLLDAAQAKKTPLEEIKNIMARATEESSPIAKSVQAMQTLQTPIARNSKVTKDYIPSAMKGVVLTSTGEPLATPSPAEIAHLFDSPRPGLNFARIFDFHLDDGEDKDGESEDDVQRSPPPSPSKRERLTQPQRSVSGSSAGSVSSGSSTTASADSFPPTRLRRPSIRASQHAPLRGSTVRPSSSDSELVSPTDKATSRASPQSQAKPLPHPYLYSTGSASGSSSSGGVSGSRKVALPATLPPPPTYDLTDEENLPSPFLKRTDRGRVGAPRGSNSADGKPSPAARTKRSSTGNLLRAVAAANSAGRRGGASGPVLPSETENETRPVIATARKASEDARKVLLRS